MREAEADQNDVGEPTLQDQLHAGRRIALSFGANPVMWYGGVIDEVQHVNAVSMYLVAFDDGDLQQFNQQQLEQSHASSLLKVVGDDDDVGGLVANVANLPRAARVARHKEGRARCARPVGVLVGVTECTLAGEVIYQAFHVGPDELCFNQSSASSNTRRGATSAQHRERLGFFTFRRGDVVKWLGAKPDETCIAHVFGVTWKDAVEGAQGTKYLVLQEKGSRAFFIGMYTQWQAVPADGAANATATLSSEEVTQMVAEFESSRPLAAHNTQSKVAYAARQIVDKGPPGLEEARKAEKRAAAKREKEQRASEQRARAKRAREQREQDAKRAQKAPSVLSVDSDSDEERPLATRPKPTRSTSAIAQRVAEQSAKELVREQAQAREVAELQRKLTLAEQQAKTAEQQQQHQPAQQQHQPAKEPVLPPPPLPLPQRTPSQPKLPDGWKSARDATGNTYYYNKQLGVSQYSQPTEDAFNSPPLPPPPKTARSACSAAASASSGGASSSSAHGSLSVAYDIEQRENRIVQIRGMLPYVDDRMQKAELAGELAMLERHVALARARV